MEKTVLSEPAYLSKAERYAASAERCREEVRLKLVSWGAPAAMCERILDTLEDTHFISETRYAEAFVHDKVAYQGWGRRKIKWMLLGKHISESVIDEALKNIDEQEYFHQLRRAIAQKKGATWDQVTRFVLQRGFLPDELTQVRQDAE